MPGKRPTYCLLIGDAEQIEFRSAIRWLAKLVQVSICSTPAMAVATAETLPAVDLIVLAQSRPGQFSADEVESLHRLWPLAKLLGLFGSWCEGEGRSGRPWPGVWRIPACSFIARMRAVLDHGTPHWSRSWQLPRLTSDAERFYGDAAEPLPNGSGVVLIAAATREAFESLADAVRQAGFAAIWQPPHRACPASRIVASIWDATRGTGDEWRAIRNLVHSFHPAPMLITLGFPRNDDFRIAREMSTAIFGSTDRLALLVKPFRLADLCGELVHLAGITVTTGSVVPPGAGRKDTRVQASGAEYDASERLQSKSA